MKQSCMRKALSAILCAALTLSVFPVMALGSEEPAAEAEALVLSDVSVSLEESVVADTVQPEAGEEEFLSASESLDEDVVQESVEEDVIMDGETEEVVSLPSGFVTYVNPYSEDAFAGEEEPTLDGAAEVVIDVVCTTVEEAAAVVREQMKARTTSFVFDFYTTNYSVARDCTALLEEIVNQALVHTGDPKEGDYLLWQYRKYDAWPTADVDGFYVNGVFHLDLHFIFSYYTSAEQEATLDKKIDSLLNTLDVSGLSDYAKLSAVYDYICSNVRYDSTSTSNQKYTAYAALVNGKAVCQGYATLLYRLALEMGIDCRIIKGTAGGVEHRWNIVRLNKSYYNLDATWDAGEETYDYFLVSDEHMTDHTRSSEYNTAAFLSAYPTAEEDYTLDAASSTDIDWGNITWSNTNGELTVSGSGSMPDCDSADQTLWAEETFTSVVITNGLTTVGSNTFAGGAVTKVTVSESVTSIGQGAFAGCTGLTAIYILNDDCAIYDSATTLGSPGTTVIYGYYNSTAMEYASKYGYTFYNLGYSNCTIEFVVTTSSTAEEPVARIYDASATDLEMYEDIVLEESVIAEESVVTISEETLREDGLYCRTISLHNVEPGKYNLAVYVPGSYVIRTEYLSFSDDANIGERHMWLYGDVDDNGLVDARDATQVYRQASDLQSVFGSTTLSATETMRLRASDVNLDGFYNEEDAQQILNYSQKLPSSFDNIP